jgi:hypothetical protein
MLVFMSDDILSARSLELTCPYNATLRTEPLADYVAISIYHWVYQAARTTI